MQSESSKLSPKTSFDNPSQLSQSSSAQYGTTRQQLLASDGSPSGVREDAKYAQSPVSDAGQSSASDAHWLSTAAANGLLHASVENVDINEPVQTSNESHSNSNIKKAMLRVIDLPNGTAFEK